MSSLSFDHNEVALAREFSRQNFYFFTRWMFHATTNIPWDKGGHHEVMAKALERVVSGDCKRLIINIPPRYGKTQMAVVSFIAWCMGRYPDSEFIHTSYSSTLAGENSYKVREWVTHAEYQAIFPDVVLKSDSKSKDHWKTTSGGVLYSAGTGGTLTGYGAGKKRKEFGGCIIIDDPHKADEARSDIIRNSVLEWFRTTLESRKNNGSDTPIIVIMQRLHEQDLAGWLLDGGNGESWEHINLSAIQPDGSALWPSTHTLEELRIIENSNPYVFAGQYLQRPAPPEGGLFKPENLKVIDALPAEKIQWVRAWDLASSIKGDWTVGAKLGRLPDGRLIIGDIVRIRVEAHERDKVMINVATQDGYNVTVSIPQDPGQAGKTQVAYLTKALQGFKVKSSLESGDKYTRAEPFASQVNIGNVMMSRGAWNQNLIHEMSMFPNGKNDDQIDALSRAFAEIIGMNKRMSISKSALNKAKRYNYAQHGTRFA
jgi:predicted phage terminase large subunit-like protein